MSESDEFALAAAIDAAEPYLSKGSTETVKLAEVLYNKWYSSCPGKNLDCHNSGDLTELLRSAHYYSSFWESGWEIESQSSESFLIKRGKERRRVHSLDVSFESDLCTAGGELLVVARRDSLSMNPGDWVTFSPSWHAQKIDMVRLYWNLRPDGIARFVRLLTEQLNWDLPYLFKCPRKAFEFARSDAGVLYIPASTYAHFLPTLRSIATEIVPYLHDRTPPMTKKLCNGLALAEDPGLVTHSFGTHRSHLLAQLMIKQPELCSKARVAELRAAIKEALKDKGIPPNQPHLKSTMSPSYQW